MSDDPFITIPTWVNGRWEETSFGTRDSYRDFVTPLLLEPGKYQFDDTSYVFNEQARIFQAEGKYNSFAKNGPDYVKYWNTHKERNRQGVIFKSGDKTWYLPRFYYMWLNFLRIYDKEQEKFDFAKVRDAQYHISLYNLLARLWYKHASTLKKRQIASEQPHSEPVLTSVGWSTMGDIKVGDKLWNPDGTLTEILVKTYNGKNDVYEFTLSDGRKTRAGIEHNWEVYDRWAKKVKVLNTKELLSTSLYNVVTAPTKGGIKEYRGYRFGIKQTAAIPLAKQVVPLDPYVMGYLLGNGSFGQTISIISNDREVEEEVRRILGDKYILTINQTFNQCLRHTITYKDRFAHPDERHGINPVIRAINDLGLRRVPCHNKFIPKIYLDSSIDDRLHLLQGLMDSDGFINSGGKDINYTTVSERLAEDVAYLARSLGICCIVNKKQKQQDSHKDFYRVRLSGDIPFDIFRLSRKLSRQKLRKKGFEYANIISIEKLPYQEDSSCIVVDNPNHLYLTRDFIVTHNSYLHCAQIINLIWFEEGVVTKMGAALKSKVNKEGSWKFLEEYRNFLNKHTAWYRPMNPGGEGLWEQKIETTHDGRTVTEGLKSTVSMLTFERDETAGVGGPTTLLYHEEGGIAPKADKTYRYSKQAMRSGQLTTGLFVIAGSVGNLEQCGPLKKFIYHPDDNDFYSVESNLLDDKGTTGKTGLFIPEQWSMPPFIDDFGNSLVQEALVALEEEFADLKQKLTPEDYQLEVSQRPRNIAEAFAHRKESKFPLHLVRAQKKRIEDKEYPMEFVNLSRDASGRVIYSPSNKLPISEFPVSKKAVNKEGVCVMYERPIDNPQFAQTYYASIDPLGEGKVTTSESLCSLIIWKNDLRIVKIDGNESSTFIERGKIVFTWCGRYDDLKKTHELLEAAIELYNAWTLVENNVALFIIYMIERRKQRYLVPKDQILFLKDLGANLNVFQEYGWKNTGTLFKTHLLSYAIESLSEELDHETKADGEIVRVTYGVERIPDIMLLTEMEQYYDGLNVDRLVSFAALVGFVKVQNANRGLGERIERSGTPQKKDPNQYKKPVNPFRHVGGSGSGNSSQRPPRNPFKNFR